MSKSARTQAALVIPTATGDGVTHINIDAGAKTELGRLLCNFAHTNFEHKKYGPFASIEGFWHWIRDKKEDGSIDAIRSLYGNAAKNFVKNRKGFLFVDNFKSEIVCAIYYKVVQNQKLYDLLLNSELPFQMYYQFGPNKVKINVTTGRWICKGVELIRQHIKQYGKTGNFNVTEESLS